MNNKRRYVVSRRVHSPAKIGQCKMQPAERRLQTTGWLNADYRLQTIKFLRKYSATSSVFL